MRWIWPVLTVAMVLTASPRAMAAGGKSIYTQSCAQCHAHGVSGAPRIGDHAAWRGRLAAGREALQAAVLKGKGAMPRKGGNASLSDNDAKAALDYMLRQLR